MLGDFLFCVDWPSGKTYMLVFEVLSKMNRQPVTHRREAQLCLDRQVALYQTVNCHKGPPVCLNYQGLS